MTGTHYIKVEHKPELATATPAVARPGQVNTARLQYQPQPEQLKSEQIGL